MLHPNLPNFSSIRTKLVICKSLFTVVEAQWSALIALISPGMHVMNAIRARERAANVQ